MRIHYTVVVALQLVIIGHVFADVTRDFQTELHDALFNNYSKIFPPTHDEAHYVNVSMELQLLHEVHTTRGIINMNIWRTLVYKDERLTWDPEAFGSITRFHVSASTVWMPDISIWNSASSKASIDSEAILFPDGTIYHVQPMLVDASCGLDFTDFPYDSHNCSIIFGSWTRDNSRIVLGTSSTGVGLSFYTTNSVWEIGDTSAKKHAIVYDCCEEVYEDVTFYMTISRRESSGRIGTAVVSVWLVLAVFLMQPSKAGERIIFLGFIFVSLVVLSAALTAEVPSPAMTRLGRFLLAGMIITGIVVVFSGIIYRFYPAEQQGTTKAQSSYSAPRVFFLFDVAAGLILFVVLTIATAALFS